MFLRLPLLLLLFCGILSPLSAQTKVQLSLPDAVGLGGTEVMCVPVVADSFPQIISASFSIGWDTMAVEFVEARFGDNPLELDAMSTRTEDPDNFGIATISSDLMAFSVAPGTPLFEICFLGKQAEGFTKLTWQGFFAPEFAQEGTITAFPFDTIQGSLTYGANVATTVLPGDTNADGQVDHRDLLNIGLTYGLSGPARPTSATNFLQQLAPRWNLTFPGGLDYANADADGNGQIETADLALVNTYYAQTLPGTTYSEAPDVSDSAGPSLTINSPVSVDAGQPAELTIELGDGNTPDAVGYSLAFALEFDPEQVDVNSLTASFSNAYLGDDLLAITKISPLTEGRVEIALSRKDQVNTTLPGGELVRISYTPRARSDNESYSLSLEVIPNAFLRSDGSSAPLQRTTAEIMVAGSVSVREPAWAAALRISPNPFTAGPLTLHGDLPQLSGIEVFDLNGRRLQQHPGNARRVELGDLAPGVYLLKIKANGTEVTRRVVKQ